MKRARLLRRMVWPAHLTILSSRGVLLVEHTRVKPKEACFKKAESLLLWRTSANNKETARGLPLVTR